MRKQKYWALILNPGPISIDVLSEVLKGIQEKFPGAQLAGCGVNVYAGGADASTQLVFDVNPGEGEEKQFALSIESIKGG